MQEVLIFLLALLQFQIISYGDVWFLVTYCVKAYQMVIFLLVKRPQAWKKGFLPKTIVIKSEWTHEEHFTVPKGQLHSIRLGHRNVFVEF